MSAEKEALAKKTPEFTTETEKNQVANHSVELKQADMNLILQLDQVVADQQGTLEKAGRLLLFHLTLITLITLSFLKQECLVFI